jgi:hypothetical protein
MPVSSLLPHHLPIDGDDERPHKGAKEQATNMVTAKRFLHTVAIAALFFGLMLTVTDDASAKKVVQTMTNARCAELEATFWRHSYAAGEASNNGDTAGANANTQAAGRAISAARAGGCTWPGEVFPTT